MEERGGPGILSKGDFSRKREANLQMIHEMVANTASQGYESIVTNYWAWEIPEECEAVRGMGMEILYVSLR